jgi:hypothetical protein
VAVYQRGRERERERGRESETESESVRGGEGEKTERAGVKAGCLSGAVGR